MYSAPPPPPSSPAIARLLVAVLLGIPAIRSTFVTGFNSEPVVDFVMGGCLLLGSLRYAE